MTNPKVSIIVPAYNTEKYINKCLTSLINQTYKNIEIIVVNDGSTDNTNEIVENFAYSDDRIKLFNIENSGVSNARNFAIKNSTGNYIAFVDSDDYISSNYIEIMLSCALENNLDLVCCNFQKISENKTQKKYKIKKVKTKIYNKTEYLKEIFTGNLLTFALTTSKIYKKELMNEFIGNIVHGEDILYNYYYLQKIDKAGYLNLKLYTYVTRKNSAVNSRFSKRRFKLMYKLIEIANELHQSKPELEKYIRTWLYFSCLESFYFMFRDKVVDKESYNFLYNNLKENKKFLRANKKVKFLRRLFAPLGVSLINLFIKKENKR